MAPIPFPHAVKVLLDDRKRIDKMESQQRSVTDSYEEMRDGATRLLNACRQLQRAKSGKGAARKGHTGRQTILRQRRVKAHPAIRARSVPSDPEAVEIYVAAGVSLEPTAATLEQARAASREVYEEVRQKFDNECFRVGAAISKFSSTCIRAYFGGALPPNSKFRYEKDISRSKVNPIKQQLQILPQPLQASMRYAVDEFIAELRAMDPEIRRVSVYRATSNAYKGVLTHKGRHNKNVQQATNPTKQLPNQTKAKPSKKKRTTIRDFA